MGVDEEEEVVDADDDDVAVVGLDGRRSDLEPYTRLFARDDFSLFARLYMISIAFLKLFTASASS